MGLLSNFGSEDIPKLSIIKFAEETKNLNTDIIDNQLILSETETIILDDSDELEIVYEDETIKIKDKSVTKRISG